MEWETVIGLEIHVQLNTDSKIFSGSSTRFGREPNTQASLVDLAMPGTLPVPNEAAIEKAVAFGLAINADIGKYSVFDRKNYFYPDLPKGYQITQMDHPIVGKGHIEISVDGQTRTIGITRAHLEEDAGKSLHENFSGMTGIDLNRAGTPLLEIVSEPDLRSAQEAVAYLRKIHSIVTYIGICDGNMAEGSLRCDANVSIRPKGAAQLGTRTEIKNVNSFRFVEKAIQVELQRHLDVLEEGGTLVQETRLYDAERDETRPMRSKEFANDYRYFPEPDLLPIEIDDAFIARVAKQLPELPAAKEARFISQYGLSEYDANVLTQSRVMADYFEAVVAKIKDAKLAANWCQGELSALLKRDDLSIEQSPVSSEQLAQIIGRIQDGTLSNKMAKQVFAAVASGQGMPDDIIAQQGLKQVTDTGALEVLIDQVIAANPNQVAEYQGGKDKLMGFFVGQIMKASKGKANPAQVNQLLVAKLKAPPDS